MVWDRYKRKRILQKDSWPDESMEMCGRSRDRDRDRDSDSDFPLGYVAKINTPWPWVRDRDRDCDCESETAEIIAGWLDSVKCRATESAPQSVFRQLS
jgi:hypothetical protein